MAWVSAGHWLPLDSLAPVQEDERLHPAWSQNLRAGFVEESLTRTSSGPHLLPFYPAHAPSCWKGLSPVTPIWSGTLKEGDLGLAGVEGGWEGLGARTLSWGSPLLLGVFPHYVQICRGGEPKTLFCFAKGVDIWHSLGNNWLQSSPFLGFSARWSELDTSLFIKGSYFALLLYKHRVKIESARCRGNLFLKDGFWKLE